MKKLKTLDISGTSKSSKPKQLKDKLPKKTSLALLPTKPKGISKLENNLTSILGDSAHEIQELLEVNNTDSATTLIQKRAMQTLIDILPYAEHNIRSTGGQRGVHAFNSLITSLRELMIDVQAVRDKGQIGDAMVEKVIRPAFLDIGMQLVLEDERVLKEIKEELPVDLYRKVKDIHQESLRRMAAAIQGKYGEAKQQAIGFMQQ